jgi:hypothetical protein
MTIRDIILLAREQRRLTAIVAADVVCHSRLMGRDESGTLAPLRALAAVIATKHEIVEKSYHQSCFTQPQTQV